MIVDSFERAFQKMADKNWDKIYVLVDVHDTIMKSSYSVSETYQFYDYAVDALKLMSDCDKISLIMWTSSFGYIIDTYVKEFKKYGIFFDMLNENVEVEDDGIGCYREKFYFNVGIDDKFGFNSETEWKILYDYLKERLCTLR